MPPADRGRRPRVPAQSARDPAAHFACHGLYVVQGREPAVPPPNLNRVSEMAVGILRVREGVYIDQAELWVDDIRLSQVVKTAGYAGAVSLHVVAADVADLTLDLSRRDAQFRQLGEDPSYVNSNVLSFAGTVRLERLGLVRPAAGVAGLPDEGPIRLLDGDGTIVGIGTLAGRRSAPAQAPPHPTPALGPRRTAAPCRRSLRRWAFARTARSSSSPTVSSTGCCRTRWSCS